MSSYKNAADILPARLLRELQRHLQGELLYIPVRGTRRPWGERSGSRRELSLRNKEICARYDRGESLEALAARYHLSVETLRKIVRRQKRI